MNYTTKTFKELKEQDDIFLWKDLISVGERITECTKGSIRKLHYDYLGNINRIEIFDNNVCYWADINKSDLDKTYKENIGNTLFSIFTSKEDLEKYVNNKISNEKSALDNKLKVLNDFLKNVK